jgi:hypothetical protein
MVHLEIIGTTGEMNQVGIGPHIDVYMKIPPITSNEAYQV